MLNVNVNVNEFNKIKREGNGTGARLETKMNPMDENMIQFKNHLNKTLIQMDSEDKFLLFKYK